MKKTTFPKQSELSPNWLLVDAEGQVLGRIATKIATILRGKHKPTFTPHLLTGDYVIVINAEKIKITGNKLEDKKAKHYTGWTGGLREVPYKELMANNPTKAIILAVKRMLPKNRLQPEMLERLKVYAGPEHPHTAQKPELIKL